MTYLENITPVWVIPIILFAVIIVSLIVKIIFSLIKEKLYFPNIKKHSQFYIETVKLNEKYDKMFYDLNTGNIFDYICKSKQTFDNNNNENSINNYMCKIIKGNESIWKELLAKESKNKNNYNDYTFKYESLKLFFAGKNYQNSKGKTLLTEKQYKKYEIEICEESLLEPTIKMNFICQISYTSPQGQNHYSQKWQVNMYSIFSKIENIKEKEKSISYQRSLMTKSKRYDILKRDNFKCKFCGRKADDGVELEVDHIIPVSKGGKTTDSNLQTLCYDCNQGKKAKM